MFPTLSKVRPRLTAILLALMLAALCVIPGSEGWAGAMGAGDRLSSEHRLSSAIEQYLKAAEMAGAGLPATLRAGRICLRRGQPDRAAEMLRPVVDSYPSNRDLQLLLAKARLEAGDVEGGTALLRGLLARRPEDVEAWCMLVEAAGRAGLSPQEAGMEAREPQPTGEARLDQRAAYLWGAGFGIQTADRGAAALLRAASGPDRSLAASAQRLLRAGDGAPDPQARLVEEGRELLAQGLSGFAMERLRGVEATRWVGAEALALKGYAELGLGKVDDAEESLRLAEALEPNQPLSAFVRALLLRRQGNVGGAARLLRSVGAKAPSNPAVDLEMASALIELGDYDGAEMLLNRAVSAAPSDPEVRLVAARFFVDRQYRVDEGLEHAWEAVRLAPTSADALETLGWAQQLKGRGREALLTLERAVALAPESARLRYRLASVQEGLGEKEVARKEYLMVGELDGAGDQWRRAKAALEGLGGDAGTR